MKTQKYFDEKHNNKNKMATLILQIIAYFLWNEFWCIGIQSPRFCRWHWILNWSKMEIICTNIPTQILLTIMRSNDRSSRFKLRVYIIANFKEKKNIHNKLILFTKSVIKIWSRSLFLKVIYSNSKFKVTSKNTDYKCLYIRTHTKEKPSKFLTLGPTVAIFSHHEILINLPSWVLWSLLFVMKLSDALQNGSF